MGLLAEIGEKGIGGNMDAIDYIQKQTDVMDIINDALTVLPADVRKDFLGSAYTKLQTVQDRNRVAKVKAVARHLEYCWRRDRRSKALDHHTDRPDPRGGADLAAIELRDLIATLSPTDQTICTMILAGHNYRDIAAAIDISPATISRRLARIREMHHAD